MEKTARTKLAERNMHWEETYTENTEKFKEMYDDIIGEGSYFRWEGKDVDSGEEYFAIVGPAKVKDPIAKWFAGCRKLPADWAAGGKYFSEIKEAMKYANETWGITIPSNFKWSYDVSDLKNISEKMDEWKEESVTEAKGNNKMNKFSISVEFPIHLYKEQARKKGDIPWPKREGNKYFDGEQIINGDPEFEKLIEEKPELAKAKTAVVREIEKRRAQIKDAYGPEYLHADFYQIFIAHSENWGTHLVVISPYFGTHYAEGLDKFSIFRKNLWIANQEQVDKEVDSFIAEYLNKYGVHLMPQDVRVQGVEYGEPTFDLNKSGDQKVKNSPAYQENLNTCKKVYNAKDETEVNKKVSEEVKRYKADKKVRDDLLKAYKRAQKKGEAFEHDIPPPPQLNRVGYDAYQKMHPKKKMPGQHTFTKIFKEEPPTGMSEAEAAARFGFDSIQEAVAHVIANMPGTFPTQKISAIKPVTSADLRRAREKHSKQKTLEKQLEDGVQSKIKEDIDENAPLPTIEPSVETTGEQIEIPPETEVQETTTEGNVPEDVPVDTPAEKDSKKSLEEILKRIQDEKKAREAKKEKESWGAVNKTILNLVKLAEVLDKENKPEDAEEIHKILRKHLGK